MSQFDRLKLKKEGNIALSQKQLSKTLTVDINRYIHKDITRAAGRDLLGSFLTIDPARLKKGSPSSRIP